MKTLSVAASADRPPPPRSCAASARPDESEDAGDEWPTSLSFSRRMGEHLRGPEYASCIEHVGRRSAVSAWQAALASALVLLFGLLALAAIVLWPAT